MCSGIYHEIGRVVMGNVIGRCHVFTKSELQDLHSRKAELIAQGKNRCIDISEVLGDECKFAQFVLEGVEDICARTALPFAIHGCFFSCWNFPVRNKRSEMIKPDKIKHLEILSYAVNPPVVSFFL